jgi:hypothetical protein
MFEVFKIVWELVVLRDAVRKGQFNWRIWPVAIGFVLLEYCVGLTAVTLYINHPEYKHLFIGVMVLVAISFVFFLWWAWRWQTRQAATQKLSIVRNQPN